MIVIRRGYENLMSLTQRITAPCDFLFKCAVYKYTYLLTYIFIFIFLRDRINTTVVKTRSLDSQCELML